MLVDACVCVRGVGEKGEGRRERVLSESSFDLSTSRRLPLCMYYAHEDRQPDSQTARQPARQRQRQRDRDREEGGGCTQ